MVISDDEIEAAKRAWLASPGFEPDTTILPAAASSRPAWIVGRVAAPSTMYYSHRGEGPDDSWTGQVITQQYLVLTTTGGWYLATDSHSTSSRSGQEASPADAGRGVGSHRPWSGAALSTQSTKPVWRSRRSSRMPERTKTSA